MIMPRVAAARAARGGLRVMLSMLEVTQNWREVRAMANQTFPSPVFGDALCHLYASSCGIAESPVWAPVAQQCVKNA
jgi:hypothetical protein